MIFNILQYTHILQMQPIPCQAGKCLRITCSLGLSIAPDDSDDFDILLKNADTAMYIAKDRGRNGWQSYNEEMSRNLKENLRLATDLRGAIDVSAP